MTLRVTETQAVWLGLAVKDADTDEERVISGDPDETSDEEGGADADAEPVA